MDFRKAGVPILSILVALAFFASGGSKLAGAEMQVQMFQSWDYPIWFMYVTGVLEVVGAALLLLPASRWNGSLLLSCVMVGAIATHLMFAEFGMLLAPVLLLAATAWIAWTTRPPRVEPIPDDILHGDRAANRSGA